MRIKLSIILSIFIYSCTEDISIVDSDINYAPVIESVAIETLHILSETDTTFLEINLFISDQNGFSDIQNVVYYVKREGFSDFSPNDIDSSCIYNGIITDNGYITTDQPFLYNTSCSGDYDLILGRACEELTLEECEGSNDCSANSTDNFLYYTFQSFNPSDYPYCGDFGTVKFQFQVTDNSGLQDLSEEIIVEIEP